MKQISAGTHTDETREEATKATTTVPVAKMSKKHQNNTSASAAHFFSTFLCLLYKTTMWKSLKGRFMEDDEFFFLLLDLGSVPKNSIWIRGMVLRNSAPESSPTFDQVMELE